MCSVYIRKPFQRAFRRLSRQRKTTMSALVNEFVREQLEDAYDIKMVNQRENGPSIPWDAMVKRLKARGKL